MRVCGPFRAARRREPTVLTGSMAGYAQEVKLFGKWSFEDVEVRL